MNESNKTRFTFCFSAVIEAETYEEALDKAVQKVVDEADDCLQYYDEEDIYEEVKDDKQKETKIC